MKYILTTTILAASAFIAQAAERTIPEKARDTAGDVVDKTKEVAREAKDAVVGAARQAGRATRSAWVKTTAYLSDDLPTYHEGANATLTGLGREIAEVQAQTPSAAPSYFRTRLKALDEQHQYLVTHLARLSSEHVKQRNSGLRHDFDRSLADLEDAIDQARNGAQSLAKNAVR
jgi:hypothetical protein